MSHTMEIDTAPHAMHRFPLRVYYEDTDAAGVVYYANYLKFAERARTEALRQLGWGQSQMKAQHGVVFVVHQCAAKFLQPARLDDALVVHTAVQRLGRARLSMLQKLYRNGTLLVTMEVDLAIVDADLRPARTPKEVHAALARWAAAVPAGETSA